MFKKISVAVFACIIAAASMAQNFPIKKTAEKSAVNNKFEHVDQKTVYSYKYTSLTDSTLLEKDVTTYDSQNNITGSYSYVGFVL